jgi:site-specific DNA-methyltransferase (cytosine-N4-specific)
VSATILRGDAACLPLPDESVDLVVTSPPYFGLRSYTDGGEHYAGQIGSEATPREFLDALLACTREWVRVLKPSGSIFVNLGDKYSERASPEWRGSSDGYTGRHDKGRRSNTTNFAPRKSLMGLPWRYAIRCIDDLGLILRAEIIWAKTNGMPESAADRVRRMHEQVFHFTREPRYFAVVDDIREPHAEWTLKAYGYERKGYRRRANADRTDGGGFAKAPEANPLGKMPGSVWEIAPQPLTVPARLGVDHFAAFPTELPRRIILGWSPPGGIVADPFGGTGTTALVADVHGRTGISVDRSADYCRLARWRVSDPAERARAMCVPKPPPVAEGQEPLFGALTAGAS